MNGDALHSIGELARRTGLTVKAIRFYSDRGIVPPGDRSPAGHRRYDADAVARLDLVRTLRDLGVDLATIRKVVDREIPLAEVAAAHAEALAVRIRVLRSRRAVLTTAARRASTPEEMELMHRLAKLSDDGRRRLVDDFLQAAFGGVAADPAFVGIMRSLTPELPDDPEQDQVQAWVELAELSQDPDFRESMRRVADSLATERAHVDGVYRDPVAAVREQAGPALAAGVDPASPDADPVVAAVTAHYADLRGEADDHDLRRRLLTRFEIANDPRRERYLRLLAVVNGWRAPESATPALEWFIRALRVRTAGLSSAPSPLSRTDGTRTAGTVPAVESVPDPAR
ncbi:MerR family transcriptional regulator [Saccharothrix violaceirubra]|uniref:DNA-binding transcriptional MerR regulator n=1 Tax=Saccharothrix violaceirubra TaxID=413306 RepID=A0A7W7T3P5_9PSEU|nr:MerR family transcriptional regulator [Saccharothrix violaceirubra]MBB4965472.1 DNA-binding transcriptional MerR regulator [Saccharothrix violaceirubra]